MGPAGPHLEESLLAAGGDLEQLHTDNMAALESTSGFLLELLIEPCWLVFEWDLKVSANLRKMRVMCQLNRRAPLIQIELSYQF